LKKLSEVHAKWTQQEKLRQFALSRSFMKPPQKIQHQIDHPINTATPQTFSEYSFKEKYNYKNDTELDEKFNAKVKEKLITRKSLLENEFEKITAEINNKNAKLKEQKENFIVQIMKTIYSKDENIIIVNISA
jgi:hypothetical protein